MRLVFRAVLMIAIVAMGAYPAGFWSLDEVTTGRWFRAKPAAGAADTGAVRDRLDQLDERTERVVQNVDVFVSDAGLTTKIKSKMALDDSVRARTIDVSTTGGVVTLAGTVGSATEHDRAVRLAQDTKGVTGVVDRLVVLP